MADLYVYKKILLPNGKYGYVREPFNPNDEFLEPPAVFHKPINPTMANRDGYSPNSGSMVVDMLMAKTEAGKKRIAEREAAKAELERQDAIGKIDEDPTRLIEP